MPFELIPSTIKSTLDFKSSSNLSNLSILISFGIFTFNPGCSACVVVASKGYPESPQKGDKININVESNSSLQIFHAGTTIDESEDMITSGGRVLSVVAQGETFDKAFDLAYSKINGIYFNGMQFRKDIGYQVRSI